MCEAVAVGILLDIPRAHILYHLNMQHEAYHQYITLHKLHWEFQEPANMRPHSELLKYLISREGSGPKAQDAACGHPKICYFLGDLRELPGSFT